MASPLLSVKNLSWRIQTRSILDDISFDIQPHQFVGLLGPNGAGKSSLMRCLFGLYECDYSALLFENQSLSSLSVKQRAQRMAVIHQEHTPHMGMLVKQVVALGLMPNKSWLDWPSPSDKRKVDNAMEIMDVLPLAKQEYVSLSGGEKQRVMLAQALVQDTPFLILDEPTNHLDVHYQIDLLHRVKRLNKTVLASIHDLNLAAAFCDELLLLDHGQLVAKGTPKEVLTEDRISQVFQACAIVDSYPLDENQIRITYAFHESPRNLKHHEIKR
ncbi:ABC transporter ATP-binding protein [Bermanella marisrubri]|uniref:Iron-compound ABC transporter, ATP-binding protein, putative n=1 Tax=Bermanella marisrubri TaxID=207949 RepID=Q1MY48_9GAMM|nr:ABC transporter ATP-binding protein [Bermanella marisrubri]EAT10912.1 iron-compound ABC transporter, ATP-binding protein, putative [Oceanobacter sp. RED65] [Bermanella marisrubri]QIZ85321.1 ABC transporter ATP-binding protein [Bermanella marisrubri]